VSSAPHVLVVEDNELVSGALSVLLETLDTRVSIAATIAETLGVAQNDPPVLTLLDLTLPDGDGLDVVAPLQTAGCKTIVALTGHDDQATRDRCFAAGCVDVLLKPVPARELMAKVSALLA
jgi:two-component system KDP operon response regulator KdpE